MIFKIKTKIEDAKTKRAIKKKVKKGAALLDEKKPGWFKKVQPGDLDLSSTTWCILGQAFKDYVLGIRELDIYDEPEEYAFDLGNEENEDAWPIMDQAWIKEINKRLRRA